MENKKVENASKRVVHSNYISAGSSISGLEYESEGSPAMSYAVSYKGKLISKPMDREQAEAKLQKLSTCFIGLELVEVKTPSEQQPPVNRSMNLLQIMEA